MSNEIAKHDEYTKQAELETEKPNSFLAEKLHAMEQQRKNKGNTMSNEIMNYDEYMRQAALESVITERKSTALTFFSTQGGLLSWCEENIAGNKMPVIVLDFIIENTLYVEKYNPQSSQSPICYALGRDEGNLIPHERAETPQHAQCIGCPQYAWGTDPNGQGGKACKSKRRLAVISAATLNPKNPEGYEYNLPLEHFKKAEIGGLRIPTTSCKIWGKYINDIYNLYKLPPFAVITMISVKPDKKNQFRMEFENVGLLGRDIMENAVIARREEARDLLDFPFAPNGGGGSAETLPQQPPRNPRKY